MSFIRTRTTAHSPLRDVGTIRRGRLRRAAWAAMLLVLAGIGSAPEGPLSGTAEGKGATGFIDLSVLVAADYPCTWPTFPPFQITPYRRIGPLSEYNCDTLILDGNTGTQMDVPPHSVTPPDSGLPNAGRFGLTTTDKVPPWQFVGEACVIDCKKLTDSAPAGRSELILKDSLEAWEYR